MARMREAILDATLEAVRLHEEFDSKGRAERGEGRVDVFDMLFQRDIQVMFQPLKNLLGAYLSEPEKGVMVTTQRPLSVQRYTAAHELGHAVLGHKGSLDGKDILARSPFGKADYDLQEMQADAFASELLSPAWLVVKHMREQGWTTQDAAQPQVVYQLALRMGSSYAAMCHALHRHRSINDATREWLLTVTRRSIKQSLARPYTPKTWHGDVWRLSERDNGVVLEGSRADLVVLTFHEHASSGYIWQTEDLVQVGFQIVADRRAPEADEQHFGGRVARTVIAEPQDGAAGDICLREVRPWQSEATPLNSFELHVDLTGPMPAGMHPAQREAWLRSA